MDDDNGVSKYSCDAEDCNEKPTQVLIWSTKNFLKIDASDRPTSHFCKYHYALLSSALNDLENIKKITIEYFKEE